MAEYRRDCTDWHVADDRERIRDAAKTPEGREIIAERLRELGWLVVPPVGETRG